MNKQELIHKLTTLVDKKLLDSAVKPQNDTWKVFCNNPFRYVRLSENIGSGLIENGIS